MRSAEVSASARIRDAAIAQFGRLGFSTSVRAVAEAAGVSPALIIHHFGSKEGLRRACDEYIAERIRQDKSAAIRSADPASWLAALAEIDAYAPMMAYLVRSLQSGGRLADDLWRRMIDVTEQYLAEGVRAGTVKPSPDPTARARYLALSSGGGFLCYLQRHDNPADLAAVLRDYAAEMTLPAVELFTEGLLTDTTMYRALRAAAADTDPPHSTTVRRKP